MSARFLGLVKLSAAEGKRMVGEGPLARRGFVSMLVEEAGGKVEGYRLTSSGDWDVVCLVEMADDRSPGLGAAATLARRAAGLTKDERWIELFEAEDVTAALDRMSTAL